MRNAMFGALALVVTAALLGCGNGNGVAPPPPGNDNGNGNGDPPPTASILMEDNCLGECDIFVFEPQVDTVVVGTTVTWANQGYEDHTSTSDGGAWDTGTVAPGFDGSHTFNAAGEFPYHCEFHLDEDMVGTVVVVPE